jgi:hypothetical protein
MPVSLNMAIYGTLSARDRLIRALISAVMGAAFARLFMLGLGLSSRYFLYTNHFDRSYAVAGALLGAFVGGILGFRRRRI